MVEVNIEENFAYFEGDRLYDRWLGPTFPIQNSQDEQNLIQLKRILQQHNVIAECVNRYRVALVGKSPHWYITDRLGSQTESDIVAGAEKLLQQWLSYQQLIAVGQDNQLQPPLFEAVKNMLVAGRGYLRLWSPGRFTNSQSVNRVCLHSPDPNSVQFVRDADGFVESIEYTYTVDQKQYKEVQTLDAASGLTVFSTVDGSGQVVDGQRLELDLGGRYSVYEMRSPPLITDSVKRSQNALNYALTLMPRNLNEAGFRERLILGGLPPGRFDESGNFIPNPDIVMGPGRVNYVQGAPLYDESNNLRGYTNPSVYHGEPVDVSTFVTTSQVFISAIYHEMRQSHLLSSDLQLSGLSREQARQDFEVSLSEYALNIEAAVQGIYGAALLMLLQEKVEQYRQLDVVAALRIATGKPTPQERLQNRQDYQAGLRSRTTAMAFSGINDTDAEVDLINAELRDRSPFEVVVDLAVKGVISAAAAEDFLRSNGFLSSTGDNKSAE